MLYYIIENIDTPDITTPTGGDSVDILLHMQRHGHNGQPYLFPYKDEATDSSTVPPTQKPQYAGVSSIFLYAYI
jgi:hypothetical protein